MSLALRAVAILALAAAVGVGIGLLVHALSSGGQSSATGTQADLMGQTTWGPGERPAPDFTLFDQNGRPTSLASLQGRDVLLTFLGPRCLRSCPREERSLATSLRLPAGPARPAVIVVSLEPGIRAQSTAQRARRW